MRSKGYGFVRFSSEEERDRALAEMQGQPCCNRPMRLSVATPKARTGPGTAAESSSPAWGWGQNFHGSGQEGSALVLCRPPSDVSPSMQRWPLPLLSSIPLSQCLSEVAPVPHLLLSFSLLLSRWCHGRATRPPCSLHTGAWLGRSCQHHGEGSGRPSFMSLERQCTTLITSVGLVCLCASFFTKVSMGRVHRGCAPALLPTLQFFSRPNPLWSRRCLLGAWMRA